MPASEDSRPPTEPDESPSHDVELENRAPGYQSGYRDMDDDAPRVIGAGLMEGFHVDPWSMRLHMTIVASLCFSIILLLMIICSRSWGVGHGEFPISAGLFKVCGVSANHSSHCPSWGEYCPPAAPFVRASTAFAIIALLLCVVMVGLDYFEMTRPGMFRLHHPCMTVGHHLLWLCMGLAWMTFTGGWEQRCGDTPFVKEGIRQYHSSWNMSYAWGWMFMIWLWVVHACIAVALTLKLLGSPLPCGL
eukprot:TRINITY_DN28429_c0_g1_i1.p1 TRINITY_DN28429_c0_g1~~TRINITY_DN28429_c0_g1_i1.p1  ORF type:complete len:247 (+),score=36.00 TRINITY_DN28429_c0_g1_i1:79-819(+)